MNNYGPIRRLSANRRHRFVMDYTLLIVYASLALGVSFMCSILEAIVLSMPHTWIATLEKGSKLEKTWSMLKADDAVKPLTAILTLNTISHTVGAAGVGQQVYLIWQDGDFAGIQITTISYFILTVAVLLLSEIIPKTLGSAFWRQLAPTAGSILKFIIPTMAILIIPIQAMKKILPGADITLVTREDLVALADLGEEEGALEEDEETVIHNLLRLKDITVKEIMTPRVVMTAFESKTTIKEVMEKNNILRFSRIPIYTEDADDIEGYVLRSEILTAASKDEFSVVLSELKKPLVSIPVNSNVDSALDKFLQNKEQIALVRDEFGGTAGIVTMEDVVETLLGEEIVDELDEVEDMRELAKEKAKSIEEE